MVEGKYVAMKVSKTRVDAVGLPRKLTTLKLLIGKKKKAEE